MEQDNTALPRDKHSGNKPVQEDKPSSRQQPMGDEEDLKKRDERLKDKAEGEDSDTNSVGIKK